MDIKDKLKQVSDLYHVGELSKAKKINDEILAEDPNNVYAKKYSSLLNEKTIPTWNKDKKVIVKWKKLKCPHCVSAIWFSSLTEEQREKIKEKKYNNLEIKCPYCHTKFVLQSKKANSMIGLKVWDFATIDNVKYRTTGYVEYEWKWHEWGYSDKTWYLEWILLWEDNSYYYFSEWYSIDEWSREYEFELSNKIIPPFSLKPNYDSNKIEIDWKNVNIKWHCDLKVKSLYWENSKIYTNGESVSLYEFNHSGQSYVIEKESSWRQVESWIYKTKELSRGSSLSLFWLLGDSWSTKKDNKVDLWGAFFLLFFSNASVVKVSNTGKLPTFFP